uniref:Uncharacterized protein n=1 Tax=Arundo donax TaxID=35708 RepID=A0A0A9FLH1_ARUDO
MLSATHVTLAPVSPQPAPPSAATSERWQMGGGSRSRAALPELASWPPTTNACGMGHLCAPRPPPPTALAPRCSCRSNRPCRHLRASRRSAAAALPRIRQAHGRAAATTVGALGRARRCLACSGATCVPAAGLPLPRHPCLPLLLASRRRRAFSSELAGA